MDGGLWRAWNETKSFYFWPTIRSISIVNGWPCSGATASGVIVDASDAIVMENEDEIWWEFSPAGLGYVKVFAGDLTSCVLTDMGRSKPRVYRFTAQDYSARLHDSLIRRNRNRTETALERVVWMMTFEQRGLTLDPNVGVGSDQLWDTRKVAPMDPRGKDIKEGLDAVANEIGASLWVDYDKVVHFVRPVPVAAAPFILDGGGVAPGSYPYWDFNLDQDSIDMVNAIRVQGTGVKRWRKNAAAIALYGRQERALNDPSITTRRKARRFADRIINMRKAPIRSGSLTLEQPGLEPMQTVRIVNPDWDIDEDFIIGGTRITSLSPNDPANPERGGAMRMSLDFSDRLIPCHLRNSSQGRLIEQVNEHARQMSGGGGGGAIPVPASMLGYSTGSCDPQLPISANGTYEISGNLDANGDCLVAICKAGTIAEGMHVTYDITFAAGDYNVGGPGDTSYRVMTKGVSIDADGDIHGLTTGQGNGEGDGPDGFGSGNHISGTVHVYLGNVAGADGTAAGFAIHAELRAWPYGGIGNGYIEPAAGLGYTGTITIADYPSWGATENPVPLGTPVSAYAGQVFGPVEAEVVA